MSFAETLIYAADTLEKVAGNSLAQIAVAALVLAIAASFALGEFGVRLRANVLRLALFLVIGGGAALAMAAVKGTPEKQNAAAQSTPTGERRVEAWIDRQQRQAEATRQRPRQAAEAKVTDTALKRLQNYTEARRALERERIDIQQTPEAQRTPDQRRRDARAATGLAKIDSAEGRINNALNRYREAKRLFALLADPEARRAQAEITLETASLLEARRDPTSARAAYAAAIAEQRGLTGLPERERRDGLASTLLRYAQFEIGQHEEKLAHTALDEAGDHYAFLRAQRGQFGVLLARAELFITVGNLEAARGEIEMLRKLLTEPSLAGEAHAADIVEARLMQANGQDAEAEVLFGHAAALLRRAAAERPGERALQQSLATALLGQSELGFQRHDLAAARSLAEEAIKIRRMLEDRFRVVEALVNLAVWEAAASETVAAGRTLSAALVARRELGELSGDAEIEGAIRLLCIGVLRGHQGCSAR